MNFSLQFHFGVWTVVDRATGWQYSHTDLSEVLQQAGYRNGRPLAIPLVSPL